MSKYLLEEKYDNIENVASEERCKIIFDGQEVDWEDSIGILRFSGGNLGLGQPISPAKVRQLEEKGFLSFDQKFNQAPTIKDLVESAEEVNQVAPDTGECRLIGYVVSPERNDCRITIEGALYNGPVTSDVRETFKELFGTGYEFSESDEHLRRWHD